MRMLKQALLILKLSLRNLIRYRKRSMLVALAVMISVLVLEVTIGFMNGMVNDMFKDMEESSGHIHVKHDILANSMKNKSPIKYPIPATKEIKDRILSEKHIEKIISYVNFPALVVYNQNGNLADNSFEDEDDVKKLQMGILVQGIEYEKKRVMHRFRDGIIHNCMNQDLDVTDSNYRTCHALFKDRNQKARFIQNKGEVVVGYKIGLTLGFKVGDYVQILYIQADDSIQYRDLKVVGFFKTLVSEEEQGMVVVGIKDAQAMLGYENEVSHMALVVDSLNRDISVSERLNEAFKDEVKPTTKKELLIDTRPAVRIFNAKNKKLANTGDSSDHTIEGNGTINVEPITLVLPTPAQMLLINQTHNLLNSSQILNIENGNECTFLVTGDSSANKSDQVELAWSGDEGIVRKKYTIDGTIPSDNTGLKSGTIIRVESKDKAATEVNTTAQLTSMLVEQELKSELASIGLDWQTVEEESEQLQIQQYESISQLGQVNQNVPLRAVPWSEYDKTVKSMIEMTDFSFYIMYLIILLVVAAIIINTVLVGVFERMRELGTLRAIGWGRGSILGMVEMESLFIGIVGSLLGVVFGALINFLMGINGIDLGESSDMMAGISKVIYPTSEIDDSIRSFYMGVIMVVLISLIPAIIAARLAPIKALGFVK